MLSDSATVLEFTAGDDDRGDGDVGAWADAATYPARFQQLGTSEALDGRDTSTASWLLILPAGATIGPRSRVRDQHDQVFTVDGFPGRPTRPGTGVHHLEVSLRAVVS